MSIVCLDIEKALRSGNTGPLWEFLESGGKVEDLGEPTLPFYAHKKVTSDLKLVKLLFERGMKLAKGYHFFYRPEQMSDDVFEWALENNLDKTNTEPSILFSLVCQPLRLKRLVERGADINVRCGDKVSATLVAHAAATNNKEAVTFLVEKGADINALIQDGWTAFLEVTLTNVCGVDMLQHLVALGADYRVRYQGETAIMIAADSYNPEECSSVEKINYLMSLYQGWADEVDDKGNTALHFAARIKEAADVIALLLEKGFDPLLANKEGITPIEICIKKDYPPSFEPFWAMIKKDAKRFEKMDLQALCEKHSADRIKEKMIADLIE